MKDLTRSLLTFVLLYGTKDKVRFQKYGRSLLERYDLDEHHKTELIDFAYEFFHDFGTRLNQVDIISRGVRSGVSDLEDRLGAILEKLNDVQSKMDEGSVRAAGNGSATVEENQ